MSDTALTSFLREKAILYLNEGTMFGKEGTGFARLNLAAPTATIAEAVARLKKALQEI